MWRRRSRRASQSVTSEPDSWVAKHGSVGSLTILTEDEKSQHPKNFKQRQPSRCLSWRWQMGFGGQGTRDKHVFLQARYVWNPILGPKDVSATAVSIMIKAIITAKKCSVATAPNCRSGNRAKSLCIVRENAHGPAHRAECRHARGGIDSALPDEVLRPGAEECAIAAMRLPENPHIKRKEILCVNLYDKGDPTFPVQQRFMVQSVGRRSSADLLPDSRLRSTMERYSQP
ncbi:hypothetical protein B0H14DRAFT_2634224 [Mycena olivaceomarginata]|nr:hypothetical protein B0H14DRAFT_2634224 [Mycena olivaceomarginata]